MDDEMFTSDEVELLMQVAQQVAIGVDNGLAYRKIAELTEKLNVEKLYLEGEIRTEHNFEEIVGDSAPLKQVLTKIEIVAPTDSTVLIEGENGHRQGAHCTGNPQFKQPALEDVHQAELRRHSHRAVGERAVRPRKRRVHRRDRAEDRPLRAGQRRHSVPRRGRRHSAELQLKFLRVLQEQEFERLGSNKTIRVDIRLVAATNRDLAGMVTERQFRSDLYYRLNVFPILNPPLRERSSDIQALVQYFTRKFATRMNKKIDTIPTETMAALSQYYWPGNIRELENFIERAVILSRGSTLMVPLGELKRQRNSDDAMPRNLSTLEDAERDHIRRALQQANWLVGGPSGAAAKLGMKRTTLQSKIAKLGIEKTFRRQVNKTNRRTGGLGRILKNLLNS